MSVKEKNTKCVTEVDEDEDGRQESGTKTSNLEPRRLSLAVPEPTAGGGVLDDSVDNLSMEVHLGDDSSRHPSEISSISYQNLLDDNGESSSISANMTVSRRGSEDSLDSYAPEFPDSEVPPDEMETFEAQDLPLSEHYPMGALQIESEGRNKLQEDIKTQSVLGKTSNLSQPSVKLKDGPLAGVEKVTKREKAVTHECDGSSKVEDGEVKRNSLEIRNNIPVVGEVKDYEKELNVSFSKLPGAKVKVLGVKQSPGLARRVDSDVQEETKSTLSEEDGIYQAKSFSSSLSQTNQRTKNKNVTNKSRDKVVEVITPIPKNLNIENEYDYVKYARVQQGNSYVGMRLAYSSSNDSLNLKQTLGSESSSRELSPEKMLQQHQKAGRPLDCHGVVTSVREETLTEIPLHQNINGGNNSDCCHDDKKTFTLSPENTECDSVEVESVESEGETSSARGFPTVEDGLSSSQASDVEDAVNATTSGTNSKQGLSPSRILQARQRAALQQGLYLDEDTSQEEMAMKPKEMDAQAIMDDLKMKREALDMAIADIKSAIQRSKAVSLEAPSPSQTELEEPQPVWVKREKRETGNPSQHVHEEMRRVREEMEKQQEQTSPTPGKSHQEKVDVESHNVVEPTQKSNVGKQVGVPFICSSGGPGEEMTVLSLNLDQDKVDNRLLKEPSVTEMEISLDRNDLVEVGKGSNFTTDGTEVNPNLEVEEKESIKDKAANLIQESGDFLTPDVDNDEDTVVQENHDGYVGNIQADGKPKGYDSDDECEDAEGIRYTRRNKGKKYALLQKDDSLELGAHSYQIGRESHHNRGGHALSGSSNGNVVMHRELGEPAAEHHVHCPQEAGLSSEESSDIEAAVRSYTRPPNADSDTDEETDRLLQKQYQERDRHVEIPELSDQASVQARKAMAERCQSKAKEAAIRDPDRPEVLIEGVLFRARYLGSTQLISEGQPSKAMRMMQAQEAVGRIKAPEGESQPSTDVDLFVSTEKIMVLNTDLQEIMMDHSLRTISYIADIGDILVVMARRRLITSPDDILAGRRRRQAKILCHVFESDEAQLIAQSIGQAFQVAYLEFLKANGIEDPGLLREMDYQDVLNQQEIYGEELNLFANKDFHKEVIVPKSKTEPLGVVIVESGWGSMVPTVVLANMLPTGPAARCGQLNIGDQIISINGLSLVGLPLAACQTYIKASRSQTVVKLTVVPCPPVVEVLIKRPDVKYQLGFSVQNGVICSLLRGGIAERGGVRVGHRIIEINNQSVVAVPHEKIVTLLASSVGEIHMKTMPTSIFRLLTGQDVPHYL